MKRLVLSIYLLYTFSGCSSLTGSPKDALSKFLTAMQNNNYAEAKKYATDESQSFLDMISEKGDKTTNVYSNKTFTIKNVEVNGSDAKAEVNFSSSSPIYFRLKNQRGGWKVNFNLGALMDMVKDLLKKEGSEVDKDVNRALDSIKINPDSLP